MRLSELSGNIDLSGIVEAAIKNVYERRVKAGDIEAGTWAANARHLWKATGEGMDIRTAYDASTTHELAAALRRNLFVFAAFKNHHMTADMVALLTDENGRLREWDEYRRLALQVSKDYNQSWLKAEYDTALASGQMAVRWQDIEAQKKALPYLRYVTAGDNRVRPAHQKLDGATMPVDDPFWEDWFPPNGWNCRCDVQQVAGGRRAPRSLPNDQEAPIAFRNNPGKSGAVFTLQHPYFQLVKPDQRTNLLRAVGKLIWENYRASEYLKDAAAATVSSVRALQNQTGALGYDAASGGFTVSHLKHSASGFINELPVCNILRRQGAMLELLDESKGDRYDLFWDGHFWDIKRLKNSARPDRTIRDYFNYSKNQGRFKLLIHVDQPVADDVLKDALYHALRQNQSIRLVQLVFNNGRTVRLTPEAIQKRDW